MLPGGPGHSAADLAAVAAAAAAQAQPDLLQLAWDIATDGGEPRAVGAQGGALHQPRLAPYVCVHRRAQLCHRSQVLPFFCVTAGTLAGGEYGVAEMADFLFSDSGAASCAAALALLRGDRLYFKQVGRLSPVFSGRREEEVRSLENSLRLAEAEAVAWAAFTADIQAAAAAPRVAKPARAAWLAGPHAERLAAVEAFAIEDLPLAAPERALATKTLHGLGKSPSPPVSAPQAAVPGAGHTRQLLAVRTCLVRCTACSACCYRALPATPCCRMPRSCCSRWAGGSRTCSWACCRRASAPSLTQSWRYGAGTGLALGWRWAAAAPLPSCATPPWRLSAAADAQPPRCPLLRATGRRA